MPTDTTGSSPVAERCELPAFGGPTLVNSEVSSRATVSSGRFRANARDQAVEEITATLTDHHEPDVGVTPGAAGRLVSALN
jgi:hypothetical protein